MRSMRDLIPGRRLAALVLTGALTAVLVAPPATGQLFQREHGGPPEERGALRVCADPNNLPFSHRDETGFENRMAELFAEALELPLEYTWVPQRFGYLRATLRDWLEDKGRYRCDVMMGVPKEMQGLSTTTEYYRSTYMLVYPKDRFSLENAADLRLMDDSERSGLKVAAFDGTPATTWLTRHGLRQNTRNYSATGDADFYPGKVIEQDMMEGPVDMAILWGPIAGYFVKRAEEEHDVELAMVPMRSEHQIQFDYPVSIGTRPGDHEMLRPLQVLLREHQETIDEWLKEYNIPIVNRDGELVEVSR